MVPFMLYVPLPVKFCPHNIPLMNMMSAAIIGEAFIGGSPLD